ncbi:hypothetical protein HNR23_004632 [Nocardiopsis mwathae]|uniref:Uncharacterized protein n=1 Tax=Nocardiopsis mwathae TaxID=1472723 RepID=A0A7X0D7F1_9ACTN|nr:hypothetical protein [Nocardiopsis mwathae]MBB6174572.1 hypothetical protein [Nocardiopsis mwathae]
MDRTGRASRVAAAVRAQTASPVRRLLVTAGFLVGAWLLGAAPAGAEAAPEQPAAAPAAEHVPAAASAEKKAAAQGAQRTAEAEERGKGKPQERVAQRAGTEARGAAGDAARSVTAAVHAVGERAVQQVPVAAHRPQAPEGRAQGNGHGHGRPGADVQGVVEQVGRVGLGAAEKGRSALPSLPGTDGGSEEHAEERPAGSGHDGHDGHDGRDAAGPEPRAAKAEDGDTPAAEAADDVADRSATVRPFPFPASAVTHGAWQAADSAAGAGTAAAADASRDGDDAPHGSPHIVGPAPQAQSPTAMTTVAGYLPAMSDTTPVAGLLQADRHALTAVPQDPAEELTVSPD